jgi:hypothetical protein
MEQYYTLYNSLNKALEQCEEYLTIHIVNWIVKLINDLDYDLDDYNLSSYFRKLKYDKKELLDRIKDQVESMWLNISHSKNQGDIYITIYK